jgi:hypothetical protein
MLQELRSRVAAYLRQKMVGQTCWQDKWHMSPLYATYHVVASGLLDREEPGNAGQRARIISWLLEKQSRLDGGWSFVKTTFWQDQNKGKANLSYPNTQADPESSNADETFHALLLLLYAQKHWSEKGIAEGELIAAIQRGIATLKNILVHHPPHTWPALWCDKTLYCPYGLLYQLSEMLVCQVVETGAIIEEMVEPR